MKSRIKFSEDTLQIMSLFSSVTKASLKDCFVDDNSHLVFVVDENQIGLAVGRKGMNVRRIESAINRKIKIVEFNPNIFRFITNAIAPLNVRDIKEENGVIMLYGPDTKTKGLLIGRDSRNLRNLEHIVARYFEIKEIKVV